MSSFGELEEKITQRVEVIRKICKGNKQSSDEGVHVIDGYDVLNIFLNEAKSNPFWRKEILFMESVLNLLNTLPDYDAKLKKHSFGACWARFIAVFSSDGKGLNCRTPVRQLLYAEYMAVIKNSSSKEDFADIIPVLALNKYLENVDLDVVNKNGTAVQGRKLIEAIEIRSAMVNLLLAKSKFRESENVREKLPLTGYNNFDPSILTQHEEFGYSQSQSTYPTLMKEKLIYPEVNNYSTVYQVNYSMLVYAIEYGKKKLGLQSWSYDDAKELYEVMSKSGCWYDEFIFPYANSYGSILANRFSHIVLLQKYLAIFIDEKEHRNKIIEKILSNNRLIASVYTKMEQFGILSCVEVMGEVHKELIAVTHEGESDFGIKGKYLHNLLVNGIDKSIGVDLSLLPRNLYRFLDEAHTMLKTLVFDVHPSPGQIAQYDTSGRVLRYLLELSVKKELDFIVNACLSWIRNCEFDIRGFILAQDNQGDTLLHHGLRQRSLFILNLLLDALYPLGKDDGYFAVLGKAVNNRSFTDIGSLFSHVRSKFNTINYFGSTPIGIMVKEILLYRGDEVRLQAIEQLTKLLRPKDSDDDSIRSDINEYIVSEAVCDALMQIVSRPPKRQRSLAFECISLAIDAFPSCKSYFRGLSACDWLIYAMHDGSDDEIICVMRIIEKLLSMSNGSETDCTESNRISFASFKKEIRMSEELRDSLLSLLVSEKVELSNLASLLISMITITHCEQSRAIYNYGQCIYNNETAIKCFTTVLKEGNDCSRYNVVDSIIHMIRANFDDKKCFSRLEIIEPLLDILNLEPCDLVRKAIKAIRYLVNDNSKAKELIANIQCEVFCNRLIVILQKSDAFCQDETLTLLSLLSGIDSKFQRDFCNDAVISTLKGILQSEDSDRCRQNLAIETVACLARTNNVNQDKLLNENILEFLMPILRNSDAVQQRIIVITACNLICDMSIHPTNDIQSNVRLAIIGMLLTKRNNFLKWILQATFFLISSDSCSREIYRRDPFIDVLMPHLYSEDKVIQEMASAIFYYLVKDSQEAILNFKKEKLIVALVDVLDKKNKASLLAVNTIRSLADSTYGLKQGFVTEAMSSALIKSVVDVNGDKKVKEQSIFLIYTLINKNPFSQSLFSSIDFANVLASIINANKSKILAAYSLCIMRTLDVKQSYLKEKVNNYSLITESLGSFSKRKRGDESTEPKKRFKPTH